MLALLVAAGCAAGAALGMWLRFSSDGAAILFVPYAIVTAALWRTPPRTWWLYLLAASAGSCLPHLRDSGDISFVLLAELVNHTRAVIAAIGLRWFAGEVRTLREIVAFLLVTALLAPSAGGLLGASLVTGYGHATDFVAAWEQWTLSNTVTAVTVLPLLAPGLRNALVVSRRRLLEVVLLVSSMILLAYLVHAYEHPIGVYWAMPFLMWSAVRFGWRGTSAVLLGVTMLLMALVGPHPSVDEMLDLELPLLVGATPLLVVAVLSAELVESRRQYRSVVEDQTELICRFRPDGTYTFANRAYTDVFGSVVGRTAWSSASGHRSAAALAQLTPESPIATHEVEIAKGRWLQWQERGLFDERDAVIEYQMVGRDITDRKRADDERRELEARRSVEVVLRENDRRKDEFLATLGHELRNPLAPVGLALEVLAKASSTSSEVTWARESIARQFQRLTRLVDDLLDLSRVTLGKIELQLGTVDLRSVVATAVDETRPSITAAGHELAVHVPTEPAWVRGDSMRLVQVLVNLLQNAAKYTERGRIELVLDADVATARVSVRDTGIGLDRDSLETIFELFSQTEAGRERAQGGLGIGLTLVKRLVDLHGGSVVARSEGRGRGTELVVTLASTSAPVALPASVVATPAPIAARLRVLAVDDNVDVANGLAVLIGMWGHAVQTANDGASALALAAAFVPDVVLLDLGLPRMDGLEVARRLRDRETGTPSLLVAITGFGEAATTASARAAGFHHHFVKPIDPERLRRLLDDCARRQRAP